MRLETLERRFKDQLLSPQPEALGVFRQSARFSADQRLGIYHNAYRQRLLTVLRADYPALRNWLEQCRPGLSETLFSRYIDAHPSRSFSLRFFGAALPEFIAGENHVGPDGFAAALAALEWAFCDAFDAADVPVLDVETLASVAPEYWPTLSFRLHPSLRWVYGRYPLAQLWSRLKQDETVAPEVLPAPVACAVWRQDLVSHYRSLEHDEASVLELVRRGANFSAICHSLAEDLGAAAPMRAASLLKTWVCSGWLSELLPAHL